jgi:hypothetical protein
MFASFCDSAYTTYDVLYDCDFHSFNVVRLHLPVLGQVQGAGWNFSASRVETPYVFLFVVTLLVDARRFCCYKFSYED